MPNDSRTLTEKQAPCECLGCAIRQVIECNSPTPGELRPEYITRALLSLARNAASLINEASIDPHESGKDFVSLFGKILHRSVTAEAGSPGASVH